jgi:hypothetical protein
VASGTGPSGWTGAVAEVDARVASVEAEDGAEDGAEEVTTGDTVLFDESPPWSVGDVHAASSMVMAVPHMTRRSATIWRLPSHASDGWANCSHLNPTLDALSCLMRPPMRGCATAAKAQRRMFLRAAS